MAEPNWFQPGTECRSCRIIDCGSKKIACSSAASISRLCGPNHTGQDLKILLACSPEMHLGKIPFLPGRMGKFPRTSGESIAGNAENWGAQELVSETESCMFLQNHWFSDLNKSACFCSRQPAGRHKLMNLTSIWNATEIMPSQGLA